MQDNQIKLVKPVQCTPRSQNKWIEIELHEVVPLPQTLNNSLYTDMFFCKKLVSILFTCNVRAGRVKLASTFSFVIFVLQGRKLAQMSVPLFPPEKIYLGVSLKENDRFGLFGLVKGANEYKRDRKANIDRQRAIDRQIDTTQTDRK